MNKKVIFAIIIMMVVSGIFWLIKNDTNIVNENVSTNNSQNPNSSNSASEESRIIDATKIFCKTNEFPSPCSTVSIIDHGDRYVVTDGGNGFKFLLILDGSNWKVSTASEEVNICDTGTDNADLIEYCKNK